MLSVREIKGDEILHWLKWIYNLPSKTKKQIDYKFDVTNFAFREGSHRIPEPEKGKNYYIIYCDSKEQLLVKLDWQHSGFLLILGYARIHGSSLERHRTPASQCLGFLLQYCYEECKLKRKAVVHSFAKTDESRKAFSSLSKRLPAGYKLDIAGPVDYTFKLVSL